MTTLQTRPGRPLQPGEMPGWPIVADLTPPELINLRWIAVLRRRIVIGLVLVVVLCAAGYVASALRSRSAAREAESAAARTIELTRTADRFAGINRIESTVNALNAQVAAVMRNDVDVARTVRAVRRALPRSMSIQTLTTTLNAEDTIDGSSGLDASGRSTIGTMSINGSGAGLDDLPAFVDGLVAIRGLVNVLPTSNLVSDGGAQFSVTISLTDQLHSHRFDLAKEGGSR